MTIAMILDAFKESPDLVAITLRREVQGVWWDIALTSDYYGRRTPPGQPHTEYFWEARRCDWQSHHDDVDGYDYKGDSAWNSPAAALADAYAQLPDLLVEREQEVAERVNEHMRRLAFKSWLAAGPADDDR